MTIKDSIIGYILWTEFIKRVKTLMGLILLTMTYIKVLP